MRDSKDKQDDKETVVTEKPVTKSKDVSIKGIEVLNKKAILDEKDERVYNVELPEETVLNELKAEDIVVIKSDEKATIGTATTTDNGKTWTVEVTAEDESVKCTYTINVTVREKLVIDSEDKQVEYDYSKEIEVGSKEEYEKVLKGALENFEEKVVVNVKDYDEEKYSINTFSKIVTENPEIDYGYEQVEIQKEGIVGNPESKLTVTISYNQSKEEMIRQRNEAETKAVKILDDIIKDTMTDVEKEVAIHDYLVKNAEYHTEGLNTYYATDHNAYGVLVKGEGVCESYAKAFYLLAKKAKLDVIYVTGVGKSSTDKAENHAWNMISLDDGWYNVDVTWDDPTYENPEDKWIGIRYKYFNVPDSIMNNTHERNKEVDVSHSIVSSDVIIDYPEAKGEKYTFDKLDLKIDEYTCDNKLIVKVCTKEELKERVLEMLKEENSGEKELSLKLVGFDMEYDEVKNIVKEVSESNDISGFRWSTSMIDNYVRYKLMW